MSDDPRQSSAPEPVSTAPATQKPAPGSGPSRRRFLSLVAAGGAGAALIWREAMSGSGALKAVSVDNPLASYPDRGWEKVYRDLYRSDSSYVFLCAPNDTHNCLLRAHVKNGVVTRIAPSYGYQHATDLDGKKAGQRWDPRCCQKGLALVRRFYGDRRCKRPMVRKGFLDWVRAGFPRDPKTGAVDAKYLKRGADPFVPVSFEEACELAGKAMIDIAKTYSGTEGQRKLAAQGYDPAMVEATAGAGTQVLKFRGGMPALGATRLFAMYRLANSLALLDDKLRGTGPEKALGARGWDNYSWHTDLPPGHPMVTGQQTVEWDLCNIEHAGLAVIWGMNWITTKMPDSHWLTEARLKGTKIVVIAAEYSSTTNKADEAIVVRPGTTPALALGLAQVLVSEKLYDADYVRANTDLPFLVRLDTGELLHAHQVFKGYKNAKLKHHVTVLKAGQKDPPPYAQASPIITEAAREAWGDFVVWDEGGKRPVAVNRDQIAKAAAPTKRALLDGEVEVTLVDGKKVKCRTVFSAMRELLDASYTPADVEKLTWAPAEAVRSLAREIARNKDRTLFALGMGPNQFFNSDLKDRAVLFVAALTRNIGKIGGNVGSYAGNYRAAHFSGLGQYFAEDPFAPELDPAKPAKVKPPYFRGESVHYFNHGDTVLRMGKELLTGKTHLPTPTKSILVANSNSLIGNAKGHYENVVNVFPRVELIAVNEWWWTGSCEYADIVFAVDSWAEMKYPDMTISVTNPFLYVFPPTPLPRIFETRSDVDVAAGIGKAIGKLTGDERHVPYWKFVEEGKMRPYLQRILDFSANTRGYRIEEVEAKAAKGTPSILMSRTYPKIGVFEQGTEGKPYYTKSGRLEFYRDEPEFIASGENLILHREPIDATFYEPNVIVAKPHPLLRPKGPEAYGVPLTDVDADTRQARHVVRTVEQVLASEHPLRKEGYKYIFHTPKYRHGTHTTPVDTDIVAIWFGPFGDMHRSDKRMPFVTEMYMDIHPADAKELGIEDGDYVWIDADPHDRPFKGWQKKPEWYAVARLMARARYYPGTPRSVTRMWHNCYGSTIGSVRGAKTNATGMAKSPETGYQSLFRQGSHQSCTRGWLKPTWMTDSLVVKTLFGQKVVQGFVPDVHCPTGAPRESLVKISKAESGGMNGEKLWAAAKMGLRPTYESDALKRYLSGAFVKKS